MSKMMKNRDTASNPYRVPRQPTAKWIKVSIVGLFLSNVALIGGVVFLVFSAEECTRVCRGTGRASVPNSVAKHQGRNNIPELMPGDDADGSLQDSQENVRLVTRRVNQIEHTLASLYQCCDRKNPDGATRSANPPPRDTDKSFVTNPRSVPDLEGALQVSQESVRLVTKRVNQIEHTLSGLVTTTRNLNQCCDRRNPEGAARSTNPPPRVSDKSLVPDFRGLPGKVEESVLRLNDLEEKVANIEAPRQLCKNGHHRYGMRCYYVGEARLAQELATQYCADDNGVRGTLAIIKDKFTHDFIGSHLSNHLHSYWIGMKRSRQTPDAWASQPVRQRPNENAGMVPSPLSADANDSFAFVDGTKVQNKVWEMWSWDANRNEGGRRSDCVALSHERGGWYWKDHDCGSKLGYVCQYFVLE